MDIKPPSTMVEELLQTAQLAVNDTNTYIQVFVILILYVLSFSIAYKVRLKSGLTNSEIPKNAHPSRRLAFKTVGILFPLLAIIFLKISTKVGEVLTFTPWLIQTALAIALVLFFNSLVRTFVKRKLVSSLCRWIGLPILLLHLSGGLPIIVSALDELSLAVGNINISAYDVIKVLIFGSLLFWLGRASNTYGKELIRKQVSLDVPVKEVCTKLFEIAVFCIVMLLLLNVIGVDITTLAVFGGAVGVGIGFGLQSIASNFISGIIILLDRSLTVGDFVQIEGGESGFVREFRMRYTVLETYDGKDILVPNEKFITCPIVNWSHKDPKQRYRVDFSVPYATDIRSMVEFIKVAVAEHEQVISGPDVPFEERPDCEIDSFGDSGINMFVEFWMIGIDDGKNRVGGDLMLIILETLRENGIEIPFPQREVKML